jgi:hypothetical protein
LVGGRFGSSIERDYHTCVGDRRTFRGYRHENT